MGRLSTRLPNRSPSRTSSSPVVLFEQEDAERAVVDDLAREVPDALEQRVEVEDGRQVAADLGQRLEGVGVAPLALERASRSPAPPPRARRTALTISTSLLVVLPDAWR